MTDVNDLRDIRSRVHVGRQGVSYTSTILSTDTFTEEELNQPFTLEKFKKDFKIVIQEIKEDSIIFDMIGIEAPLANAFRRILLSEVPTMAIERVVLYQNTSIIQDEVLAHRLGLIPIRANPKYFQYVRESSTQQYQRARPSNPKENDDKSITISQTTGERNELNTLLFVLDVKCTRNEGVPESAPNEEKYNNSIVYSKQLKWIPQGSQAQRFKDKDEIQPHYPDIVIAKLRPNQSIEAELYVEKGIGQQHAKWSPVATASYRLMPEIIFTQEIVNESADELKKICPMNVFDIEDIVGSSSSTASRRAIVARPRNCSMCRECIRGEGWNDRIKLRRIRDHFLYSVETVGHYSPTQVVKEAINVLKEKANTLSQLLQGKQRVKDETQTTRTEHHNKKHNNNKKGVIKEENDEDVNMEEEEEENNMEDDGGQIDEDDSEGERNDS